MRRILLVATLACRVEADPPDVDPAPSDDDPSVDTEPAQPDTGGADDDGDDPVCASAEPEVCGNGVDDDGDARVDCAIEGWEARVHGTLVVQDAGWLFAPGDLNGDGRDDVVGYNAVDTPAPRTAASVLYGPFAAGRTEAVPASVIVAQGYTGTEPVADRDLDGDGRRDLLLPMVLESGLTCEADVPWEIYLLPLDATGELEAAASSRATLRAPSGWAVVAPAVYVDPVGDVDGNDVEEVFVKAANCANGLWRWYLVDGTTWAPGTRSVDEVAYAFLTEIPGETLIEAFGLGDVDGDGRDDLGISTLRRSDGRGTLYVITEPPSGAIDLEEAWAVVTVGKPGSGGGGGFSSVAGGRDVTGDGLPDLVLGTVGAAGGAWVLEGPLSGGEIELTRDRWASYAAPDAPALRVDVGDLNADGEGDVVIGVFGDGLHVDHAPCAGDHALPADGVPTTYANQFVLLDATGDGFTDVVVSMEGGTGGWMGIVKGGPAR